MKTDKYISELLFEYDCVIVPEFGGFVANYTSAKIHPTQHTFTPPSKNIIFNKNLKNNDGLLANHIASAENTSYPEALKHISLFASSANAQLKNAEKVRLGELGTLYQDAERNIQFERGTANYLLDAFGLVNFYSPPLKLDNIGKRIEKEFKDRAAIPSKKKKTNIKRYLALAIVIPFIFGMIWIPLKTDVLKNIHNSDFNPFATKVSVKNTIPEKIKLNVGTASKPIAAGLIDTVAAPVAAVGIKVDSTSVSIKTVITNPDLQFHLVTGCFQIRDNADNFVIDLQNQNITASIIGERNGLYIVSAGDYTTRREALIQLQQLRNTQPDAWLLKK